MHEIEHGETLRKIASAGGIFLNISPPTTSKKSFFRISAMACGRSNTMHLNPGKASAIILTEVPVPPPTSTRLCKPSNICGVHVPVSLNTSLRWPQTFVEFCICTAMHEGTHVGAVDQNEL